MKYIWPIISNLITLGVVWGILSQLSYEDDLQTIAALVILAYANLLTQMIVSTRFSIGSTLVLFGHIATLFKNQGDLTTSEEINTDVKNIKTQVDKKTAEFYVNMGGIFLIWVSCVIVILGNL